MSIRYCDPVNEDTLIVNWENREEASDSLPTVKVVIAAFVTAQARLKLYSYLEQLEERDLYYDTDSVIYFSKPGEFDIPTGEFVDDMTDELEKEGLDSYITEFVSGGPKIIAIHCGRQKTGSIRPSVKSRGYL
ncbi:hypothetical protein JTB14_015988 [Gonioctena quinquepunctata]|nr:hypothetical protein JTB14_015988 [Gonioctena quinquepunctata]